MKIMKSIDKKVGDKIYYKYKINLPKNIVENNDLLNRNFEIVFEENKIVIIPEKIKKIKKSLTDKQKKIQKELLKLMKEN